MKRLASALTAMVLLASCASSGGASTAASAPASATTGQSATPVPTPGPSSVFCPNPEGGDLNTCLGWLKGGTYNTSTFRPALTYNVPAGWGNLEDLPGNFLLLPVDGTLSGVNDGTSDYLGIYTSVAAAGKCTGQPSSTVPQTWQGLVDWLTSDPALAVTNLKPVTVSGLEGDVMEIAMKDPSGDGCDDPTGIYADVYVGVNGSSLVHSVTATVPLRIYLLKHGDQTLAIEIQDAPGGYYGDWPTTADAAIAKLQITP